jgi:hypothetical protein
VLSFARLGSRIQREILGEAVHGSCKSRGVYFRINANWYEFGAKGYRPSIKAVSRGRRKGRGEGDGNIFLCGSAPLAVWHGLLFLGIEGWTDGSSVLHVVYLSGLVEGAQYSPPNFGRLQHVQFGRCQVSGSGCRLSANRIVAARLRIADCGLAEPPHVGSRIRFDFFNPKSEIRNRLSGSRLSTLSPRPSCIADSIQMSRCRFWPPDGGGGVVE